MLSLLVWLPIVGAVVVAFAPRATSKALGLAIALATAAVAVVATVRFDVDGGRQFREEHEWIEAFGVHYALGLDGLGLLMVLLTVLLVPLVLAAEWFKMDGFRGSQARTSTTESPGGGARAFVAWALALEGLSLAVFCATDVFLFYVVFEATLIPAYFLVGSFGLLSIGMIVKSPALRIPLAWPYAALPVGIAYFMLEFAIATIPDIVRGQARPAALPADADLPADLAADKGRAA